MGVEASPNKIPAYSPEDVKELEKQAKELLEDRQKAYSFDEKNVRPKEEIKEAKEGGYTQMRVASKQEQAEVQSIAGTIGMTDDELAKLASEVFVAIPHRTGEGVHEGICEHFPIWGRIAMRIGTFRDPHGGFIEITRANIVRSFLEYCETNPEVKYLVMIDNDESIEWHTPLQLARHDLPVVGGVVCGFSPERGIFACFTMKDRNGVERFPSFQFTGKMPAQGVIKVKQVGAGLVCIRKDVLETIIHNDEIPFYIEESVRAEGARHGHLKKGEDIAFSDQCEKCGFDRYIDLSVHARHWKTLPLEWPASSIDPNLKAEDWEISVYDHTA